MNPEIKNKWVAALRSGEYKQGFKALKREEKFCCLGVLCDLHRKEIKELDWIPMGSYFVYAREASVLPVEVRDWAGLESIHPNFEGPDIKGNLIQLNDTGVPFNDIADVIEKYL